MFQKIIYPSFLLLLFTVYELNCESIRNETSSSGKSKFKPPEPSHGPWTPVPRKHSQLLSLSSSSLPPLTSSTLHHKKLASSSSTPPNVLQKRNLRGDHTFHIESTSNLPTPIIKHHANGATVGLDIPDSNLRLLLDIDDLASKPSASQIGVKVFEKSKTNNQNMNQNNNNNNNRFVKGNNNNNNNFNGNFGNNNSMKQFLGPAARARQQQQNNNNNNNNWNNNNNVNNGQNQQQNIMNSGRKGKSLNLPLTQNYKIGLIRTSDLHKAINNGLLNVREMKNKEMNENINNNNIQTDNLNFVSMTHSRPNKGNIKSNSHVQRMPMTSNFKVNDGMGKTNLQQKKVQFSQPLFDEPQVKSNNQQFNSVNEMLQQIKLTEVNSGNDFEENNNNNVNTQSNFKVFESPARRIKDNLKNISNSTNSNSTSSMMSDKLIQRGKTNSRQRGGVKGEQQQQQMEEKKEQKSIETEDDLNDELNDDFDDEKISSTTPAPANKNDTISGNNSKENSNSFSSDDFKQENEEEQENDGENDESDDAILEPFLQRSLKIKKSAPSSSPLTNENIEEEDDEIEEKTTEKPMSTEVENSKDIEEEMNSEKSAKLKLSSASQTRPDKDFRCSPMIESIIDEPFDIRSAAESLEADEIFKEFPSLEDQFQSVVDFTTASYTIFLPSNEAFRRLPKNLIEKWKENAVELNQLVDTHVLDEGQTLNELSKAKEVKPRAGNTILTVQNNFNETWTVNGQRVVLGNQRGPLGGTIHVISGILYPRADKNLMETLKACNKFDGFVTLAEGTGLGETLASRGPWTVFVPSNEALQKIPDSDLELIRNNMTALKEFLMYHVAEGSYYSSNLKDGMFIPTILGNNQIQVGVRVDGCSRRLVEANVSPLYRADIPASNGVIHVIDWILKPNDRDWCDNVILPR